MTQQLTLTPNPNSGISLAKNVLQQQSPGFFDNLFNSLNQLNVPDYVICDLYYINNTHLVIVGQSYVYHKQTDGSNPDPLNLPSQTYSA